MLRRHWLALLLILLGGFVRLHQLDLTAFGMDEGVASLLSQKFWHHPYVPAVGVKTSLHFYNPPLLIYLLIPLLGVWSHPLFPLLFIALANLGGCLLFYAFFTRHWGREVGLGVLFLLSMAPLMFFCSRRLWGHSFVGFLSVFCCYGALCWVIERKPVGLWVALLCALLAAQFHFSGILLGTILVLLWLLFKPPVTRKSLLGPLLIAIVVLLPYSYHLVASNFLDFKIILSLIFRGLPDESGGWGKVVKAAGLLLNDGGRNDLLSGLYGVLLDRLFWYRWLCLIFALLTAGLTVGLAAWLLWGRSRRRTERVSKEYMLAMFSLVWWLVPVVIFGLLRVPVVPLYLLPAFPGLIAMVGWMLVWVKRRRALALLSYMLLLFWGIGQALYLTHHNLMLAGVNPDCHVHTVYRYKWETVKAVAEVARYQRVIVVENLNTSVRGAGYGYVYLLWRAGREPERFEVSEDFTMLAIIVDSKFTLPAHVRPLFEERIANRFGNLRLYFMPRVYIPEILYQLYQLPGEAETTWGGETLPKGKSLSGVPS